MTNLTQFDSRNATATATGGAVRHYSQRHTQEAQAIASASAPPLRRFLKQVGTMLRTATRAVALRLNARRALGWGCNAFAGRVGGYRP